jgi:hypothetical protein
MEKLINASLLMPNEISQTSFAIPSFLSSGTAVQLDRQKISTAKKNLTRALSEAVLVETISGEIESDKASQLMELAKTFVMDSKSAYSIGQYFQSGEMAKTALNLYQAAKTIFESELGYVTFFYEPEDSSFRYSNAPTDAKKEIAKTKKEIKKYLSGNNTASELFDRACNLVKLSPKSSALNFADLAKIQAAAYLAKAARYSVRGMNDYRTDDLSSRF